MNRRVSAYLLAALLWCSPALAQMSGGLQFPGPGTPHSAGGGGYTGPGDIYAFGIWAGLRAYSAATAGTKAIELCDSAGANCADVSTNATTGVLNAPGSRGADNCNSVNTCTIRTIYDKAGSALDCVQTTTANRPTLNMTGGPGGGPAAVFVRASTQTMTCGVSTGISNTQPFTYVGLAERTGTTGSFNTVLGSGGPDLLFNSSANGCGIYAGSVFVDTTHCADNAWHAMQGMFNNASSQFYIDGNSNSGTAGTAVSTSNFVIGNGIGGLLDGRVAEIGVAAGDKSASFSSLNSNMHTFWGF